MMVDISDEPDTIKSSLASSGSFTIKSMYVDLTWHTEFTQEYIWKIKVPQRNWIFIGFLYKKVRLTKHNLAYRNWNLYDKCFFCDSRNDSTCLSHVLLLLLFGAYFMFHLV
jgi:hypothetical protein